MGTFELINAIVSLIGGGILTAWSQRMKDQAEFQRMSLERFQASESSTVSAREHPAPWQGFYWVRSAIALLVIAYFFLVPVAAVFMDGIQVIVGYYDTTQGFWPWSNPSEAVTWVKTGAADASKVIVYDPVRNNVLISIIGMYFGNQFTRRG